MNTKSALEASSAASIPSAARRPAIRSESLTFIWQPNVFTKKRLFVFSVNKSAPGAKALVPHFAGVVAGRLRQLLSPEHPRDLLDAILGTEGGDLRRRPPALHALANSVVAIGQRRNLGKVGHAEDLVARGHRAELLPHHLGHAAADAGIDLVE